VDLAAATGVSVMGLSYLERGARKPHKGTVQKVENGLGLPPGTYARLLHSEDPAAELSALCGESRIGGAARVDASRVDGESPRVNRHSDADVLEAHAEAHLESLNSLIDRLPPETSNEYETYIRSVIAQSVKAELLAANSWRVAVNAGAESTHRLLEHVRALEAIRSGLLDRLRGSLGSRFDRACAESALPEPVVAAMLGVSVDELWDIRNRGVIPPGMLPRVRAFVGGDA